MFHKYIKLVLVAGIFVLSVFQFIDGNIGNGISLILLAGIPLFLYFRNELLLLAFLQMRKQNMEGTKKWLDKIKNPSTALIQSQEAYYYYMNGLLLTQTNMTQSEKLFKKALGLGLRMSHDIAMAKLNLAGIAMSKRRKREATQLLNEAKKLDKHNMLAEQIKMMKNQMKRL